MIGTNLMEGKGIKVSRCQGFEEKMYLLDAWIPWSLDPFSLLRGGRRNMFKFKELSTCLAGRQALFNKGKV